VPASPPQQASIPPPVRVGGSTAPQRRQRGGARRHRGRVKEVYMDGRWVQVTGEGPVIAPGRERSSEGRSRAGKDDDTPSGPLSVPL
jgi:hypothetical protein